MSQNLLSAAGVIGALKVNPYPARNFVLKTQDHPHKNNLSLSLLIYCYCFDSLCPWVNFSVMSGRVFLGGTSTRSRG